MNNVCYNTLLMNINPLINLIKFINYFRQNKYVVQKYFETAASTILFPGPTDSPEAR